MDLARRLDTVYINESVAETCKECIGCKIHYGHCNILMGVSYNFDEHYWYFDRTGNRVPSNGWQSPPNTNQLLVYNLFIGKNLKNKFNAQWTPSLGTDIDES